MARAKFSKALMHHPDQLRMAARSGISRQSLRRIILPGIIALVVRVERSLPIVIGATHLASVRHRQFRAPDTCRPERPSAFMPSDPIHRGPRRGLNAADPSTAETTARIPVDDLEAVFRKEAPRLTRYFRARLRTGDDPGDFVQESFARLVGSMSQRTLPAPGAYLQRIARNLLYDRAKRSEVRLASLHVPIGEGCEPVVEPDQTHAIEAEDVMRAYRRAVAELPDRTRQVFLLHRVDELAYREIGERLGISIPTVQYHFARALAHIDAALERE